MEYIGPTLIVLAILIAVAVAAVAFEPANPFAKWLQLAKHYATPRRPSAVQYAEQKILFGGQKGRLTSLNEFVRFDVTIDDFGLWLVCKGIETDEVPLALKVPGTHVRFHGQHGRNYLFDLFAEPPVRIAVHGELGEALQRRCES